MGDAERATLDFNAIYLETEVLVRSGWPALSVEMENVFKLAHLWEIPIFLPEPVERQIEERCIRQLVSSAAALNGAVKKTARLLSPLKLTATAECANEEDFRRAYRRAADDIKRIFRIAAIPFSSHKVSGLFELAIRYRLPFESKEGKGDGRGEGKGFQDAVILAAVLEHLVDNPKIKGVLVTADGVFSKVDFDDFGDNYSRLSLKIMTLDELWKLLYGKYWEENIKAPWHEEMANAGAAVKAALPQLRQFIESRLTPDMIPLGLGSKVVEVLSVDQVEVYYAHTPIPDPSAPNRHVRFAVSLGAKGRALIERDYSYTKLIWKNYSGPLSEQVEDELYWVGGVEASADIIDRQFTSISFEQLLPSNEVGKWLDLK